MGEMSRHLALWLAGCLVAVLLMACGGEADQAPPAQDLARADNVSSLYLDGDDDFVAFGMIRENSPLQLAGAPFTLAAWFRQQAGGDPYQRIIDKSDGPMAQNGWALGADAESGMIHFYVHDGESGGDLASSRGLYSVDQWHFVVAVARRDRLEIWLDGKLDEGSWYESGSFTLPARFATGMRIGTWNHDSGREWHGWLDEVAVWSTDLPPETIEALYRARGNADLGVSCGAYDGADSLEGWWRMGSGARLVADPTALTWTVEDLSGGGLEGSLRPPRGPQLEPGEIP